MKFDFDTLPPRRGTGSMKWDDDPSVKYPLWVADMDFPACPAITEALHQRIDHGVFGYAQPTDSYYEAVVGWHRLHHAVSYDRRWFIIVPGVVPAISSILRALTKPGDGVLTLSPVYNCFYSSIRNLGCRAEESELRLVDGQYEIDFDDFERRASLPDVGVFLLCSPHNPTGRIWTSDELARMAAVCHRHRVCIVSDEIHCELVMPGQTFVPLAATVGDSDVSWITLSSASKAFNIAGLQNAQIIIPDDSLRRRVDRAVNIHEVCDVNPLGLVATEAAYRHGYPWLEQLRSYLHDNYLSASKYLTAHHPELRVAPLQATYLMWLDVRAITNDDEYFCADLCKETGVRLAPGSHYGQGGQGHVRINMATPRRHLLEAMELLTQYIDTLS